MFPSYQSSHLNPSQRSSIPNTDQAPHRVVAEPNRHSSRTKIFSNNLVTVVTSKRMKKISQTIRCSSTYATICYIINTALGYPSAKVTEKLMSLMWAVDFKSSNKMSASRDRSLETSIHMSWYDQSKWSSKPSWQRFYQSWAGNRQVMSHLAWVMLPLIPPSSIRIWGGKLQVCCRPRLCNWSGCMVVFQIFPTGVNVNGSSMMKV